MKKANVATVHKKEDKTLEKNYRPILLVYFLFFEKCLKQLQTVINV